MSHPHPSWSDPARRLDGDRCEHGFDWASICLQCRTGVDYESRPMGPVRVVIVAIAFVLAALFLLYGYIELVAVMQ